MPAQLAARLRALFGKHGGQELGPFRHPARASERKEGRAFGFSRSVLSETAGAWVREIGLRLNRNGLHRRVTTDFASASWRGRFEPLHWRESLLAQPSGGQAFVVVLAGLVRAPDR